MVSPLLVRSWAIATARVVHALFFLIATTYALLTYHPFAYQQFIRPHLIAALSSFVTWHHLWYWLVLLVTALTLAPAPAARRAARLYLALAFLFGVVLTVRPILPRVENNWTGLVLAFGFLVPPIWLAAIDHLSTRSLAGSGYSSETRVLRSGVAAAALVWMFQTLAAPLRWNRLGELAVNWSALLFGAATSLVLHVALFTAVCLLVILLTRLVRAVGWPYSIEYAALGALGWSFVALVCHRLVFAPIAFEGPAALALAGAVSLTLLAVWSAVARRLVMARARPVTAAEAWLAPIPGASSPWPAVIAGTIALLAILNVALERAATFDWDFLVQNLIVVLLWLLVFALAHRAMPHGRTEAGWRGPLLLAASIAALGTLGRPAASVAELTIHASGGTFVPEFALDGFAALDPSYRLIRRGFATAQRDAAAFHAYLRENTAIEHVELAPVHVEFAEPLSATPGPKPHIFLFVIDSLRRDYLHAYNPSVTFTPSFDRLARESFVFERAFTRYGGTGLSVPALWAGGLLIHQQYVKPFGPMNALHRLLVAEGYEPMIGLDSIMSVLLADEPAVVELDRGVPTVRYDLCRTLDEVQEKLARRPAGSPSVFVYTLPQNLHISRVRSLEAPAGADYPGFFAPVAAEIERMDECFGRFLDRIQSTSVWENSVVILTSDHGDSLGEGRRWGHSYTMFPEVAGVPLIIRVPSWLGGELRAEVSAPSFTSDITPTLYGLLGHAPKDLGRAYGRPIIVPRAVALEPRSEPVLLASSYGAVYALVSDEGRTLYVADGVNETDYAYDLSNMNAPVRVGITDSRRQAARHFITSQIGELAAAYGLWR